MTLYNQYGQQQQYTQGTVVGQERELEWGDTIVQDEQEYILLAPGEYEFIVESFERSRSKGSEKMPASNMAVLNIRIDTPQGKVYIKHNLTLHSKLEGIISAFFASIGQKRKGEPLQMNWNLVPGSVGKCKIGRKVYNNTEYNEIKSFLPMPGYDKQPYKPGTF